MGLSQRMYMCMYVRAYSRVYIYAICICIDILTHKLDTQEIGFFCQYFFVTHEL